MIRTKRLRYYGHPDLIHYLQHLANQTRLAGMPDLYIADLAMMHGALYLRSSQPPDRPGCRHLVQDG